MLASRGLNTLPCGVPSLGIICFPVSGSMYPATSDFRRRSKVLSHVIHDFIIFSIISWGILSKHLDMSPCMTHW